MSNVNHTRTHQQHERATAKRACLDYCMNMGNCDVHIQQFVDRVHMNSACSCHLFDSPALIMVDWPASLMLAARWAPSPPGWALVRFRLACRCNSLRLAPQAHRLVVLTKHPTTAETGADAKALCQRLVMVLRHRFHVLAHAETPCCWPRHPR
jgi:hypothetical protein